MKILIDCRAVLNNFWEDEITAFIRQNLSQLIKDHPDVQFLLLMDQSFLKKKWIMTDEKNIIIKKSFPGNIGWKIWHDWQVPSVIKKLKVNGLIGFGGIASPTSVTQCVWVPGSLYKKEKGAQKKYARMVNKKLQSPLTKASFIVTDSEKSKQVLLEKQLLAAGKIKVLYGRANKDYHSLSWTEKENTKIKYSGGREYFIVIKSHLSSGELLDLFKAFSQFKKRQQTNMQLVFARPFPGSFTEKLETFKHRQDIHVYNMKDDELIKAIPAAYALLHPFNDAGNILLNAFASGTPVITTKDGCMEEIAGDAALYAPVDDRGLFASQMMLLFKDESLRTGLIEKGKIRLGEIEQGHHDTQSWNEIFEFGNLVI